MTLDEKLQFIADRIKDEKEFYIGSECDTYRFRNSKLRYVKIERTDEYSPLSLNYFLSSPLKLKPQWEFTEDEKAILRLLPTNYRWIARDKDDNRLYVYALKPEKGASAWVIWSGKVMSLGGFKHLFESIQWSDDEPCEFREYIYE